MEMEKRVSSDRDASVQPKQLVSVREDGLLVALRSKESNFEVPKHSDPPQDCAALHAVLAGGGLEARKEIFPVGELHENRVPFASRLHELTGSGGLRT